jgi:hypothetical protein
MNYGCLIVCLLFVVELCLDCRSLMAILAGLNTSAVHRLNRHWNQLPKKKLKLWDVRMRVVLLMCTRSITIVCLFVCLQELNELMSSDSSFKLYRQALDEASLPAIPYVGVHLTDLFFKEDAK